MIVVLNSAGLVPAPPLLLPGTRSGSSACGAGMTAMPRTASLWPWKLSPVRIRSTAPVSPRTVTRPFATTIGSTRAW